MSAMTSSKKKNLGKNMKPRGIRPNATEQPKAEEPMSAGEVQGQGVKDPVAEAPAGIETPVKQEAEVVQNLDSADVAPEKAKLDALLMGVSSGPEQDIRVTNIQVPWDGSDEDLAAAKLLKMENGKIEFVDGDLGQQEDGTFKIVVTIREGLISPIEQQAEADRQTSEEWVSERFGEWLDSWWAAPQGR
jgi:hypothetical protein